MDRYQNFDIALYLTVRCIEDTVEKGMEFFERHMSISKVYLETYRDGIFTSKKRLLELKSFFENKGIKVSGAITPTVMRSKKCNPLLEDSGIFGSGGALANEKPEKGVVTACETLCYTNEAHKNILKKAAELTAELFDEFILDDFFSTCCTCPRCIEQKGEKSWQEFRLMLMAEVSENVVVKPAKAKNPNVNVIIKYPNWYESYQEKGYNPKAQKDIFDFVYTGTETRDPHSSDQHLPRYGSYSLVRWLENVKPGCNLGGWIDSLDTLQNLGYYLEQAHLTLFAKAKELTLFCYSWLVNTVHVPALGFELNKIDQIISTAFEPTGINVYQPYNATGEDHLYDYLGNLGLALEPSPNFTKTTGMVLLTESSAVDVAVLDKVKNHLISGGNICLTTGFLKAMGNRGINEITTACHTNKKITGHSYRLSCKNNTVNNQCVGTSVTIPVVEFKISTADALASIYTKDNNFPVLLKNKYGNGNVYVLTIPDDFAQLYSYPAEVLSVIRMHLMQDFGIYFEGEEKIALFLYCNSTFIIQSFQNSNSSVKIHMSKEKTLVDAATGEVIIPAYIKGEEAVCKINLSPINYKIYNILEA